MLCRIIATACRTPARTSHFSQQVESRVNNSWDFLSPLWPPSSCLRCETAPDREQPPRWPGSEEAGRPSFAIRLPLWLSKPPFPGNDWCAVRIPVTASTLRAPSSRSGFPFPLSSFNAPVSFWISLLLHSFLPALPLPFLVFSAASCLLALFPPHFASLWRSCVLGLIGEMAYAWPDTY